MSVESGFGSIADRYHGAVATVWLAGAFIGHLHLSVEMWTVAFPFSTEEDPQNSSAESSPRRREMIEWMLVWANPEEHPNAFIDGVEADADSLSSELDQGHFVLGGTQYGLKWLDGPEKSRVLTEVFGLAD